MSSNRQLDGRKPQQNTSGLTYDTFMQTQHNGTHLASHYRLPHTSEPPRLQLPPVSITPTPRLSYEAPSTFLPQNHTFPSARQSTFRSHDYILSQAHGLGHLAIDALEETVHGLGKSYLLPKLVAIEATVNAYQRIKSSTENGNNTSSAVICGLLGSAAETSASLLGHTAVIGASSYMTAQSGGAGLAAAIPLAVVGFDAVSKGSKALGDIAEKTCLEVPQVISHVQREASHLLETIFLPREANAQESSSRCQRPSYESALQAFNQVDGYHNFDTLSEMIGGKVKENLDAGIFKNACAIRGSRLFSAPETKDQVHCEIPRIKGETVSGDDGSQYIYRLNKLAEFLTEAWGQPDCDTRKDGGCIPQDAHGVVIHLWPQNAKDGFTGHFEVTDKIIPLGDLIYWRLEKKPKLEETITPHAHLNLFTGNTLKQKLALQFHEQKNQTDQAFSSSTTSAALDLSSIILRNV